MNLATAGRGLVHEGLAAGLVSAYAETIESAQRDAAPLEAIEMVKTRL